MIIVVLEKFLNLLRSLENLHKYIKCDQKQVKNLNCIIILSFIHIYTLFTYIHIYTLEQALLVFRVLGHAFF